MVVFIPSNVREGVKKQEIEALQKWAKDNLGLDIFHKTAWPKDHRNYQRETQRYVDYFTELFKDDRDKVKRTIYRVDE